MDGVEHSSPDVRTMVTMVKGSRTMVITLP